MSFFGRIRKTFSLRAKAALGGVLSWAGVNWSNWTAGGSFYEHSPRNSEAWLKVFQTNSQVRAVVNRIAEDVASVKYHLQRRQDGPAGIDGKPPAVEVFEHTATDVEARILRLMRHPNPHMTGTRFRWLITVWLEMTGRAPLMIEWEKVGRARYPRALFPIPPHRVVSIPTQEKPYFKILSGRGQTKTVSPEDIIWINYPDVLDPYGMGSGPACSVDDEVSQVGWAGVWNNNFYRQGAHPGAIVAVKGGGVDAKNAIEQQWESKHTGVHNAHRTLFLPAEGIDVKSLGPTHKELDFVSSLQYLADRIRFNWGVPPELLGDIRNSNRATAQASAYIHQTNNLAGRVMFLEEHFNLFLLPLFGDPELYLCWDNPVQQTEELLHQALTEGYTAGTVTRDEWRMGHKMDPVGGDVGNQFSIPLNTSQGHPLSDNEEEVARAFAAAAKTLHRGGEGHRYGAASCNGAGLHR